MNTVVSIVELEVEAFLLLLAATVVIKALTGDINLAGLFCGRITARPKGEDRYFSPERVQLMVFTLMAGAYYRSVVANNPKPGTMPPVPESWPAMVGGSNLIYLAGKAYSRWLGK